MNVAQAAAEIFKREGVEFLLAYPLNPLTESCAAAGIRPIIVRQERVGLHMADAISRMTSGEKVGVFACQAGPGVENAFGAVAQAWSEGVPLIFMPGASPRGQAWIRPNFNAALNFQHIVKQAETINTPDMIVPALRRAFTMARNGRPGPVLIEVPGDMWNQELKGEIDYRPTRRILSAPSHADVDAAAAKLIDAKRPLLYAGQGIHYAKAWPELKAVAELLEIPVTTSLEGKSSFPETTAVARLGWRRDAQGGVPTRAGGRRHFRCRRELHRHGIRHPLPDELGQDVHTQHPRPDGYQQEYPYGLPARG